jgi:hypothetical protein
VPGDLAGLDVSKNLISNHLAVSGLSLESLNLNPAFMAMSFFLDAHYTRPPA